ncbi:MAG: APC family permease [Nitrososphaerales archaeon]
MGSIKLLRNLSLLEAVMIGLGPTIGPTIFVVPRLAVEMAGSAAIFTFILAGVFSLFIALNYADMSSRIAKAGGGYSFVSYALGGVPAFLSGWFMHIGNVAYAALSAYTAAIMLSQLLPISTSEIAALILALFLVVNLVGVKKAGSLQVMLTSFVFGILLLFILFGVFKIDVSRYELLTPFVLYPVFSSLGYVFSIYIGFELITNVSEEVKRARKVVPKAIILTIIIALLIFPSIIAVLIGTLDYSEIISSETPLIKSAFQLFSTLGFLMAVAAVIASLASLNASLIAASRTLYSLSRDRHIPKIFENIHASFRTPYFSLLFTFALALLIVFLFDIELIVYISDLAYLLGLIIINPAGILIKRRSNGHRRLSQIFIPLLALISTLLIIPTISFKAMIVGLMLTVVGFVLAAVELIVKSIKSKPVEE